MTEEKKVTDVYSRDSGDWVSTVSAGVAERPAFTGTKAQWKDELERKVRKITELQTQIEAEEKEKAAYESNPSPETFAELHAAEGRIVELKKKLELLLRERQLCEKALKDFEAGRKQAEKLGFIDHIHVLYLTIRACNEKLASAQKTVMQSLQEADSCVKQIQNLANQYASLSGEPLRSQVPISLDPSALTGLLSIDARRFALAPLPRFTEWPRPEKTTTKQKKGRR